MDRATTHIAATPAKLSSGAWGAKVSGDVKAGDTVTITTRAGKSWDAKILHESDKQPRTTTMTSTEIVAARKAKVRPHNVFHHIIHRGLILLGRNQFNGEHLSIGPHVPSVDDGDRWAVWDGNLCVPDGSYNRAADHFRRKAGRDGVRRAIQDRLDCLEF